MMGTVDIEKGFFARLIKHLKTCLLCRVARLEGIQVRPSHMFCGNRCPVIQVKASHHESECNLQNAIASLDRNGLL